jgi:cytochrome P450
VSKIPPVPGEQFDHHSAEFAADRSGVFETIRSQCPVAHTDRHGGYWVISKYADVVRVAKDPQTFASGDDRASGGFKQGVNIPGDAVTPAGGVLQLDPPEHNQFRRIVSSKWSPTAATRVREDWEADTTWLIDQFIEKGECESLSDLLSPMPAMVTLRFLGIPLQNYRLYSDAMHMMMFTPPDAPERPRVEEMLAEMTEELRHWVERKRVEPGDDYLTFLNGVEVDGKTLSADRVLSEALLTIGGGLDTTTALMSHTVLHLSRNRADKAWLMADRSRMQPACEEFLRFYAPVPGIGRTAMSNCLLRDAEIAPGDRLFVAFASANLDQEVFEDANQIRLDRTNNNHVTFGVGQHRCLGQHQARQMWDIVIWQILTRMPDFEVVEAEIEPYPFQGTTNGFITMPLRFTPGPRLGGSDDRSTH